jgi:hypothetical protein
MAEGCDGLEKYRAESAEAGDRWCVIMAGRWDCQDKSAQSTQSPQNEGPGRGA